MIGYLAKEILFHQYHKNKKSNIKEEKHEHDHKVLLIASGAVVVGVGGTILAKNYMKKKREFEQRHNDAKRLEDLEAKVHEFNSNRITNENSTHSERQDMERVINETKEDITDVQFNKDDYTPEEYEEYETIEDDLNKDINVKY